MYINTQDQSNFIWLLGAILEDASWMSMGKSKYLLLGDITLKCFPATEHSSYEQSMANSW